MVFGVRKANQVALHVLELAEHNLDDSSAKRAEESKNILCQL